MNLNIIDTLQDPNLFRSHFEPTESWHAWRVFLKTLFAHSLDPDEFALYCQHTGRKAPPTEPAREAWVIVGRRGGKSFISALVAVFLACFRDYASVLAKGERGTLMVLAADRRQARVVFRYIEALIDGVGMLAPVVEGRTREAIHLSNGISIEVHAASYRGVRGYTLVGVIADEIAFWRDETSANPDVEILAALRPGMATVPGALLLAISSPYSRRGELWRAYRQHYGRDGDPVLVWRAPSRIMNPTLPEHVVARALEEDPSAAAAEYIGEFRTDIEGFVSREAVEACVEIDRRELPPLDETRYLAFVDPSGGSADSMTLAIAHRDGERVVLDAVRERRPPFSPEDVVAEFGDVLKRYHVSKVTGDRYAGEWPRERFRMHGVEYALADRPKRDLYRELLPVLNSRRVELLDNPRLVGQLVGLERRTARGGRDAIDHAPGAHDDLANVVAGVTRECLTKKRLPITWGSDRRPRVW